MESKVELGSCERKIELKSKGIGGLSDSVSVVLQNPKDGIVS